MTALEWSNNPTHKKIIEFQQKEYYTVIQNFSFWSSFVA